VRNFAARTRKTRPLPFKSERIDEIELSAAPCWVDIRCHADEQRGTQSQGSSGNGAFFEMSE
jgi:hypothetical protein